jgi:hypothetical protein
VQCAYKVEAGGDIEQIQALQQRQARDCNVREARVDLAPLIAAERSVSVLQCCNIGSYSLSIDTVQCIQLHEHLNRAQRVQQMRIVMFVAAKSTLTASIGIAVNRSYQMGAAQRGWSEW